MTACTRNCWIFAALCGLTVWALAAGSVGAWAGLFLGFVTAWLLGGLMVMLFCEGRGGEAADELRAPTPGRAVPLPRPMPDAPRIAEAQRPAGMQGAPEGAGAATSAVTFAAMAEGGAATSASGSRPQAQAIRQRPVQARPIQTGAPAAATADARQAVTFGAVEASMTVGGMTVARTADTPLEDTRAIVEAPSASADHTRPGEAVPAAEKPVKDKKFKDKSDKKDKKSKDKAGKDGSGKDGSGKDKAGKDAAKDKAAKAARKTREDAGSTDVSRAIQPGAQADAPLPAMTLTTPLKDGARQDDLGRIDGIGPKLTVWLNENGITRFAQIAAWTSDEAADWAVRLGRWGGRIDGDDWIGQARILAAGGETAHSRRVDQGEST